MKLRRNKPDERANCVSYLTLTLEVTWLSIMGSLITRSLLIGGQGEI